MSNSKAGLLLVLIIALAAFLGVASSHRTPEVVPADGPTDRFSAGRALEDLNWLAAAPRPGGSDHHEEVRRRLVEQVEGMGFAVEVQETVTSYREPRGLILATDVANILVRVPGSGGGGKAALLVCHYDTVPNSDGASDDGVAVVAFLETLRVLSQGESLANDLIFLFADGEEAGLMGARAFLQGHRWAQDVGVVANFESRGVAGPSLMFETSEGNGRLVQALGRSVSDPVASSYSFEVYKVLPNDTDFSVFRRAGLRGMNFAYIHGPTGYHTAADSVERLDPGSLQHTGNIVLGLARHLGEADLGELVQGGNRTYFNLPGGFFLSYPSVLEIPLALLAFFACVILMVRGFRSRNLRPAPIIGAVFLHFTVLFFFGVVAFVAAKVATAGSLAMGPLGPYNFSVWGMASVSLQLVAVALVMLALSLWVFSLARKAMSGHHLFIGGMVSWALLGLLVAFAAGGASYLFTLPVLLGSLVALPWLERLHGDAQVSLGLVALLALVGVGVAFLWAPPLALVGVALSSAGAAVIGGFLWLLVAGLLAPQVELLQQNRLGKWLPVGLLLAGLGLSFGVRQGSSFGPENPQPDTMIYAYNVEKDIASWFSLDQEPDAWTEQFLGTEPQEMMLLAYIGFPRPSLRAEAPKLGSAGARVELVGVERSGTGAQNLDLRIRWDESMDRARLYLASNSDIRALHIGGERLERLGNIGPSSLPFKVFMVFQAIHGDGFDLRVEMEGDGPLEIEIAGQRYGLPQLVFAPFEPRSEEFMPDLGWETDSTFIRNAVRIDPRTFVPGEAEEQIAGEDGLADEVNSTQG